MSISAKIINDYFESCFTKQEMLSHGFTSLTRGCSCKDCNSSISAWFYSLSFFFPITKTLTWFRFWLPPTSARLHLPKALSMACIIFSNFESLSTNPSPCCQNQTSFTVYSKDISSYTDLYRSQKSTSSVCLSFTLYSLQKNRCLISCSDYIYLLIFSVYSV